LAPVRNSSSSAWLGDGHSHNAAATATNHKK
jgi:hypothetical protein